MLKSLALYPLPAAILLPNGANIVNVARTTNAQRAQDACAAVQSFSMGQSGAQSYCARQFPIPAQTGLADLTRAVGSINSQVL